VSADRPSPVISRRRAVLAVGLLLAVVGVGVAYALTLSSFSHETGARKTPFVAGNPALANGVNLDGRTLAVSPELETATVRLSFRPKGALIDASGRLVHPLVLLVESATGPIEKTFKAGEIMRPEEVTLALVDGYVASYPFDSYHTGLDVLITRAGTDVTVPTALDVFAATHGFSFALQQEGSDKDGGHFVNMTIRRSGATRFFSLFLMVTMWALTLAVLGMLLRVLVLGRAIQFPMFTFLAALLFAFPAIRNAQPSVPPIGVLSDYLSFFWCEALVAASLITLLSVWIGRRRYD
jgi:hypothetical protein